SDELALSPFSGPPNLRPTVVFGSSTTHAVALGLNGDAWRIERFTNQLIGILVAQPAVNFGRAVAGSTVLTNLTLRNLGDSKLTVTGFLIDGVSGAKDGFSVGTKLPLV